MAKPAAAVIESLQRELVQEKAKHTEDIELAKAQLQTCETGWNTERKRFLAQIADSRKLLSGAKDDEATARLDIVKLTADIRTKDQEIARLKQVEQSCARLQKEQQDESGQLLRKNVELEARIQQSEAKFQREDSSHKNTRAELDACRLALQMLKAETDATLAAQAAELAVLKKAATDWKQLEDDARSRIADEQKRAQALEQQVATLQAALSGVPQGEALDKELLRAQIGALEHQKLALEQQLREVSKERDELRRKEAEERARAAGLEARLQQLDTTLKNERQQLAAENTKLQTENLDLKAQLVAQQQANQMLQQQQLQDVTKNLDELQQKHAAVQAQVQALEQQLRLSRQALAQEKARADGAQALVQQLQQQIAQLQQALNAAPLDQKDLAAKELRITDQAKEIARQAQEIGRLQTDLQQYGLSQQRIAALEAQIQQLDRQIQQLQADLLAAEQARDQAEQRAAAAAAAAPGVAQITQDDLARARAEGQAQMATLQRELNTMREEIAVLKQDLEDKKRRLADEQKKTLTDEECAKLLRDTIDTIEIWQPQIATSPQEEPQLVMAGRGLERIRVIARASSYALETVQRRVARFGRVASEMLAHPLTVTSAKQLNQVQRSILQELGGVFQRAFTDGRADWRFNTKEDRDYAEDTLKQFGFQGVAHELGTKFSLTTTEYVFQPVPVAGAYYSPAGGQDTQLDPGEQRLEQSVLEQLRGSHRSRVLANILQNIAIYYRGTVSVVQGHTILVLHSPSLSTRASQLLAAVGIRHTIPSQQDKQFEITESVGDRPVPLLPLQLVH